MTNRWAEGHGFRRKPDQDDAYRIVTAKFVGRTDMAFIVQPGDNARRAKGRQCSIPRSLIHGGDDIKLDRLKHGEEFTFRLREWKAEELGLAGTREKKA